MMYDTSGFNAYDWPLDSCEVWGLLISKPLSLGFDTLNKMVATEPFGFNHA